MCRNRILLLLSLLWVATVLFTLLMPFLEVDLSGVLNSHLTEEFILMQVICSITGVILLLTKFITSSLGESWLYSYQLLLPPITAE
jgi:hypothetical protein